MTTNDVRPAVLGGQVDLDALLAERRLDPVPVKLGGHVYHVRRDLRTAEMLAFWAQLNRGGDGDVQAFAILFGPGDPEVLGTYDTGEAQRFVEVTGKLPREHEVLVTRQFVIAAGLKTEADFEQGSAGESRASSPA